jgi:hypothetical protein
MALRTINLLFSLYFILIAHLSIVLRTSASNKNVNGQMSGG